MPIEVKTNFGQFNMKAIKTFKKKYQIKNWVVAGIEGNKVNGNYLYPWEI